MGRGMIGEDAGTMSTRKIGGFFERGGLSWLFMEQIFGFVERITYQSEENGFTAARLKQPPTSCKIHSSAFSSLSVEMRI